MRRAPSWRCSVAWPRWLPPSPWGGAGVRACGLVFTLPPGEERGARTSASSTGASLDAHFSEFAATRWRALKLPAGQDNLHLGEQPAYVELPEKYLRAFGVEAEDIQSMDELVPPHYARGRARP